MKSYAIVIDARHGEILLPSWMVGNGEFEDLVAFHGFRPPGGRQRWIV